MGGQGWCSPEGASAVAALASLAVSAFAYGAARTSNAEAKAAREATLRVTRDERRKEILASISKRIAENNAARLELISTWGELHEELEGLGDGPNQDELRKMIIDALDGHGEEVQKRIDEGEAAFRRVREDKTLTLDALEDHLNDEQVKAALAGYDVTFMRSVFEQYRRMIRKAKDREGWDPAT